MKVLGKSMGVAALLASLGGCSPVIPPHVASEPGAALTGPVPVTFNLPAGETPSPFARSFGEHLSKALAERGAASATASGISITIAIAIENAESGITQASQGKAEEIDWIAKPYRHRFLDSCHPQRLRVVASLNDRNGASRKLASGEVGACKIGDTEIQALANTLAEALIRR